MKIFVLTDIPSPYQTEIFNAVSEVPGCELHVAYLRAADPGRQWKQLAVRHAATILTNDSSALERSFNALFAADIAVFNYYRHPHAERLISERARLDQPWCFWGERPGLSRPELFGRVLRSWKLRPLHSSAAPIWGIGRFAIDRYRSEFGSKREYFNLPYYSNLERFRGVAGRSKDHHSERTFIFCGALILRKGVDLLARSFRRLVQEGHRVKLRIVGDGKLRGVLDKYLVDVAKQVTFVGFKDWDDLPAQYAMAEILCVPSRYDGWGLVVTEGLASGLPVIATDRMGAAIEFVETGRNGWLISAGKEEALLNAMRAAATLSDQHLSRLSTGASHSIRLHTLQAGAIRFVDYARNVVSNWRDNGSSCVASRES